MANRKAVVRILVCVGVLILAGVTAMAIGSKDGFMTINGGRMTVALRGPSGITAAAMDPEDAQLKKIFSNLGTGSNVYNCCTGWTISAVGSVVGQQYWIAEAFTPANNATVTKVKIAVENVTGTNGVTIGISNDHGGVPGKLLISWPGRADLPIFGTCCTLVKAKNTPGIPLKGGTQYWLVVKTSDKTSDTWDAFNWSNAGVGPVASNTGSGWTNLGDSTQGAVEILGN